MKIDKKQAELLAFLALYLFALFYWSLPYQERNLPYGEYDAMSHFQVADFISQNDASFVRLPPYIDLRYWHDNKFRPHTLWYPPTFHSSLAAMQTLGGDRVLGVFLMNTILNTFILITLFLFMRNFFGFLPGMLSSLLLIFSPRDIMPYLWGQWPERFGYAFVPLIIYCYYKYNMSFDEKPLYICLTSILLIMNLLVHPMVFFHSLIALAATFIFLSIKDKKIKVNFKHVGVCAVIFIAIFFMFPLQTLNMLPRLGINALRSSEIGEAAPSAGADFSRIFRWSFNPEQFQGSVPASYFSFSEMHGLWTLPLLLLGVLAALLRRKDGDLLLLAWLVSLYIVLHRDAFGMQNLIHRSLSASAHIFVPLAVLGMLAIPELIKLKNPIKGWAKYPLAAVFVYMALSVNMAQASQLINKDTYNNPLTTLTQDQFDAAEWIMRNAPLDSNVSMLGVPHTPEFLSATAKNIRWFAAASQHVTRFYYLYPQDEDSIRSHMEKDYIMLDYYIPLGLNMQELVSSMQEIEEKRLSNQTLVFNKNTIRVYKLES